MKTKTLFASALAVLGLTACEKSLNVGEDISPTEQVKNSVLQVRTRGSARPNTALLPLVSRSSISTLCRTLRRTCWRSSPSPPSMPTTTRWRSASSRTSPWPATRSPATPAVFSVMAAGQPATAPSAWPPTVIGTAWTAIRSDVLISLIQEPRQHACLGFMHSYKQISSVCSFLLFPISIFFLLCRHPNIALAIGFFTIFSVQS